MVTSVIARAVRIRGGLTHACIDEVEVGSPLSVVLDLPAAVDPVAVVAEAADEALVEGLALARERPLAVADGHLVDPADAAVVGVELEVGAAGRVAITHVPFGASGISIAKRWITSWPPSIHSNAAVASPGQEGPPGGVACSVHSPRRGS